MPNCTFGPFPLSEPESKISQSQRTEEPQPNGDIEPDEAYVQLPLRWFLDPLKASVRKLIRPPTSGSGHGQGDPAHVHPDFSEAHRRQKKYSAERAAGEKKIGVCTLLRAILPHTERSSSAVAATIRATYGDTHSHNIRSRGGTETDSR